jgi:hypothetical protein
MAFTSKAGALPPPTWPLNSRRKKLQALESARAAKAVAGKVVAQQESEGPKAKVADLKTALAEVLEASSPTRGAGKRFVKPGIRFDVHRASFSAWVFAAWSPKSACFDDTSVNTVFCGEQTTATAAALR